MINHDTFTNVHSPDAYEWFMFLHEDYINQISQLQPWATSHLPRFPGNCDRVCQGTLDVENVHAMLPRHIACLPGELVHTHRFGEAKGRVPGDGE